MRTAFLIVASICSGFMILALMVAPKYLLSEFISGQIDKSHAQTDAVTGSRPRARAETRRTDPLEPRPPASAPSAPLDPLLIALLGGGAVFGAVGAGGFMLLRRPEREDLEAPESIEAVEPSQPD